MNRNATTQHHPDDMVSVWVVEDNNEFRSDMQRLIADSQNTVCEQAFDSCEPMLAHLQDAVPPDVILMDIGLPGISGLEGTKRVKAIAPSVQVIMLTSFDEHDKIFQAVCAGASGYLLKSDTPERILASLGEIVSGGAPINAQIARKVLDMFTRVAAPKAEYDLTVRETEILRLLVDGLLKKQIADQLDLSYHTVDTHIRNIYGKLHVNSRSSAVAKVLRENVLHR